MTNPSSTPSQLTLAADLVSAYVSRNSIPASELPELIQSVHRSVIDLSTSPRREPDAAQLVPAVPIRKSVETEFLICLEDGKRFKSLKRYLWTQYSMTPDEYREKWGLPSTYPMVAPAYGRHRSALAVNAGFGRRGLRSNLALTQGSWEVKNKELNRGDFDTVATASQVGSDPSPAAINLDEIDALAADLPESGYHTQLAHPPNAEPISPANERDHLEVGASAVE